MSKTGSASQKPVLVVGCGSIGQRHLKNLKTLGVNDLYAFDLLPERLEPARKIGARPVGSLKEGLCAGPASVIVCTPPDKHLDVAMAAIQAGADVLIEKPISEKMSGLEELIRAADQKSRVLMVGYNLRFHSGMRKMKELLDTGAIGRLLAIHAEYGQYLPDWRPKQDYRKGYMVSKNSGGGIILESSHEIDYVRWLGGEVQSVSAVAGRLSRLEMETEDTAFLSMRHDGGVLSSVRLDCVQREYTRSCKLVGSEGTLVWEYPSQVRWYSARDKKWSEFPVPTDPNEMYVKEMEHFFSCVREKTTPLIDGPAGARVLAVALAAIESAKTRKEIPL